jgi:hypothetical protein
MYIAIGQCEPKLKVWRWSCPVKNTMQLKIFFYVNSAGMLLLKVAITCVYASALAPLTEVLVMQLIIYVAEWKIMKQF